MFRRSSRLRDRGVATPPHAPRWTAEADYNMQRDSLLFSIPPELRDIIFRLTLAGYYDESRPYPPYAHYNRPGYRFPVLIHTALLRTCKRVYMETAQLLAILNEAVFWCGNGSPELGLSGEQRLESLSAVLADEDVYQPRLHLFTKQRWLEQAFVLFCKKASLRSKILVITIRHSDWWYWEQNDPLEMKKGWTESTEYLSQLEELWVELEAMERDKDQIRRIADEMKTWTFKHKKGNLKMQDDCISETQWTGKTMFIESGGNHSIYNGAIYNREVESWFSFRCQHDRALRFQEECSKTQDTLKYVVITLKWSM